MSRFYRHHQQLKKQWWPAWRWDQWGTLLLICVLLLTLPSLATRYTLLSLPAQADWQPPQPALEQPLAVPIVDRSTAAAELSSQLTARAAYVTDLDSGAVLLNKNGSDPIFPASVLKLLTALVARQQYHLDDRLTQSWQATSSGTVIGLRPGETLSVRSALAASLIASGNDAATLLALHDADGLRGFVAKMQQKAQALHLETTIAQNPTGLDDPNQHTSVRDLSLLAREIQKDEVLKQMVSTSRTSIFEMTNHRTIWLQNTNELLGVYPGVMGMKTGTTDWAGENIILLVNKNEHPYLVVIAGSLDRYQDAKLLMNWIDQHVQWKVFVGQKE